MWRLDMVPSANNLVRPANIGGHARLVKTSTAKAWVEYAKRELAGLGLRPLAGPLEFEVHLAFGIVSADISNRIKQLEDVLTGAAWFDDCQVVSLVVRKRVVQPGEAEHVLFAVRTTTTDPETARRLAKSDKANGRPSKSKAPKFKARADISFGGRPLTPSLFR